MPDRLALAIVAAALVALAPMLPGLFTAMIRENRRTARQAAEALRHIARRAP